MFILCLHSVLLLVKTTSLSIALVYLALHLNWLSHEFPTCKLVFVVACIFQHFYLKLTSIKAVKSEVFKASVILLVLTPCKGKLLSILKYFVNFSDLVKYCRSKWRTNFKYFLQWSLREDLGKAHHIFLWSQHKPSFWTIVTILVDQVS